MDFDGASVGSFESSKEFSSLVFSSADIQSGVDYSFTVDGAVVATATGGEELAGGMGGPRDR